jgi:hypothetical protein
MAYIDPDDYWAGVQWHGKNDYSCCPACGMTIPATDEGILGHAEHHLAEYERLFVWPEIVLEDLLDAELVTE